MRQVSITLPLRDNDGVSLCAEHEKIKAQVIALAGAYTQTSVEGIWQDSGVLYHDESIVLTVYCNSRVAALLVSQVPEWCQMLRQLCLLVSVTAATLMFVSPVTRQEKHHANFARKLRTYVGTLIAQI